MRSSERGATLYEATILITAMATLTAVAAPVGGAMLDRARVVNARQQVSALASAMDLLLADQFGRLPLPDAQLFVSDGEAPQAADAGWSGTVDGERVLPLSGLLYDNSFGLSEPLRPMDFGWRGPYMQQQIGPDPWGSRYAISVAGQEGRGPLVILSAGPDGSVEAPFGRLGSGMQIQDDDILFVISS